MTQIGISSFGSKLPKKRLNIEDTINVWKNGNVDLIKNKMKVESRTVLDSDEDLITLAIAAAKNCLENGKISEGDVESLYLGTTTASDLFRASSTIVMDMLSAKGNYLGGDIKASEKSGTAALISAYAIVSAGIVNNSLVIGADVLNKHMAPGDLRESYIGAGAASLLIGKENVIAEIQYISSYNTNFPEQFRPEDERFLRVLAPLNAEVVNEGMVKHCYESVEILLKKSKMRIGDFDYGVFQQFTGSSALVIGKGIGMNQEKILPSIFANKTGDTGSASPLIGLSKVLEIARPNDKILLCSYGHGTGSDAISLCVTDKIVDFQKSITNTTMSEMNDDLIMVSYEEAMKYEYKYVQPNIALSTFL